VYVCVSCVFNQMGDIPSSLCVCKWYVLDSQPRPHSGILGPIYLIDPSISLDNVIAIQGWTLPFSILTYDRTHCDRSCVFSEHQNSGVTHHTTEHKHTRESYHDRK